MILFRRRSPESPWEEVPNACFELQDAGFEYRYFFSAAPTLPVQQDDEALEVLRRVISTWESPWPPGADPMAHVMAEARALLAKRGAA